MSGDEVWSLDALKAYKVLPRTYPKVSGSAWVIMEP